ncbi:MAG: DUF3592 domain-containing protein [Pirellulales bacterium]|nr:DUF3592 domain-containing protein [Pirellulales bacterium]
MPRTLRLLTKKRGGRTTGSDKVGGLWLMLFFAAMFFAGWGFLVSVITIWALPEWNALQGFEETTCDILKVGIEPKQQRGEMTWRPSLLIRYEVAGHQYEETTYDINRIYTTDKDRVEAQADAFSVTESYPCFYDPADPRRVVLVRGITPYLWFLAALALPFISVGALGLGTRMLAWRTSAERRAYLASQASKLPKTTLPGRNNAEFPTIPKETNLTNSPGTHLAYRLPMQTSRQWSLLALWTGSLLWNIMVSVFATLCLADWMALEIDWWLTVVTLIAAVVGVWLIWMCVRSSMRAVSLGRTLAEVSKNPLRPGASCETHYVQFGRMTLRKFRVLLVCEETATFEQGTNTRTESRRVFMREILSLRNIHIRPEEPLTAGEELNVPAEAMHSFRSAHNAVSWKLVVEGRPRGWPPFERAFPLVILPADQE